MVSFAFTRSNYVLLAGQHLFVGTLTELTQKVPPRSMQILTLSLTGAGIMVKLMDVM